ncbi:MAG: DUF2007 domain-containing protein [Odoribacteraceae bacterium]|jgi:hypothetical protein|nr:DUF2007 domain-containing protein [Odoribacteraceae bacterium]
MNKLVTVMTFNDPVEVSILRGRLEAEGIRNFARDEMTSQILPLVSDAIGGIKLQVRERDVKRTVRLLRLEGYAGRGDFSPSPLELKLYRFFSRVPLLKRIYRQK